MKNCTICIQVKREPVLFASALLLLALLAGYITTPQAIERGPFPFEDPAVTSTWEMGPEGPELVVTGTVRFVKGVQCDENAVITRYWDLGGEKVAVQATRTSNRPTGISYPINQMADGTVGGVRFRLDEVPWNAQAYVTVLTAPIGSCGEGGWWGEREAIRAQIPPRPDFSAHG